MAITSFPIFTGTLPAQHAREVAMAAMLFQVLADEHRLFIFARNCHWYTGSQHYITVQRYYETFCMEMDIVIDAIREKVLATGYYSKGLLQETLEDVHQEAVFYISCGKEQLQTLQRRHYALQDRLWQYLQDTSTCYAEEDMCEFLRGLAHQHACWSRYLQDHLA